MSKFKVGDRVRAIRDYRVVKSGMVGTVKSVYCSDPPIGVEWDTLTDGHDGNGCGMKCERGKGYYVEEADIELLGLPSIHITTNGKTTHAVLKEGGKVSKRAKAICSPHDEFDFETGARIAFDRLCTSLAENSAFKGVREVKRPAKVGEWVKFIKDHGGKLTPGSIHRVKSERDGTLFFHGSFTEYMCSDHDKYVVLEGYTPPEPEKPKYYNGKVVCVEVFDDAPDLLVAGKVYTVDDGRFVWCGGTRSKRRYTDFQDLVEHFGFAKLIEFKGEA